MSELPWSKFFWSDWEADQGLRLCSLSAQGLWMRMLCVCAKGEPKGYLAINGQPLDETGVARLCGITADEASGLMGELETNGVFSRDRRGWIYSRRMMKDAKRAAEGKKNAKKRWAQAAENKTKKAGPNGNKGGEPSKKPNAKKPEARGHNDGARDRAHTLGDQFKPFWEAFPNGPNKGGDVPAIQAFRRRLESGESAEDLTAAAAAYAKAKPDTTFATSATKFLDNGEYKNFLPVRVAVARPDTPAQWRRYVRQFTNTGAWHAPGPKPGSPGCLAPPEILSEFDFKEAA